jgi:hypothetical protein
VGVRFAKVVICFQNGTLINLQQLNVLKRMGELSCDLLSKWNIDKFATTPSNVSTFT